MGIFSRGTPEAASPEEAASLEIEARVAAWRVRVDEERGVLVAALARWRKRVDDAEARLAVGLERKPIARLGQVLLYDDEIVFGTQSRPLQPGTIAEAEFLGQINRTNRFTVTRFAALGIFALAAPKARQHDDREVYILIEAPDWVEGASLPPNLRVQAMEFARSVEKAASGSTTAREKRIAELGRLAQSVRDMEGDRGEVNRCRGAFDAAVAAREPIAREIAELRTKVEGSPDKGDRRIVKRIDGLAVKLENPPVAPSDPESTRDQPIAGIAQLKVNQKLPIDQLVREAQGLARRKEADQRRAEAATERAAMEKEIEAKKEAEARAAAQAAAAEAAAAAAADQAAAGDDLAQQLERLAKLHEAGALSAEEFAAAKARLLA